MSGPRKLTKSQIAQDWVKNHSKSSGADRLILLIFASYVNKHTGETYPSIDPTVIRETGMKRSAIFRAIAKLDALGELKFVRKRFNAPSVYEIVGPMYGTELLEDRPTNGTKVGECRPISDEVRPRGGTLSLKSSKDAAAAKRIAYRKAGRRKLDAEKREGTDALAATIGREDFGEAIESLIEAHPDWTGEQIGEAVTIGSAPLYSETVARCASKTPDVTFCAEHHCYFTACPPSSGHRMVHDLKIYGWRLFDPALDRGETYLDSDGSEWEICACNNGNGADCEKCGNSGSILVRSAQ